MLLDQIKVNGINYDTIEIPTPEPPYIILEILSKDKNLCRGNNIIIKVMMSDILYNFYKIII